MQFKDWLMLEAGNRAQMEVDPSVGPQPFLLAGSKVEKMATPEQLGQLALQGLKKYFTTVDPRGFRFAKERFTFKLMKAASSGTDGLVLKIGLKPLEKNPGEDEIAGPDHPMHSYYQKYGQGKTGNRVFKTPKDAIESIPEDSSLAYRGISWEEWQDIRRSGFIGSRGMYNLGQEGYTLFGQTPTTALHYANGFAPVQFTVAARKPGVVIAIPRSLTLTHKDDPRNIPDTELGVKGKLSSEHIKAAWLMTPQKMNQNANIELIFPYVPAWDENKYKDPMTGFYKLSPQHMRTGGGSLAITSSYSIRKLF